MSASVKQEFDSYHRKHDEVITPEYDKAILTASELIRVLGCSEDCSLYGISCEMSSSAEELSPINEISEDEEIEELSPDMQAEEEKGTLFIIQRITFSNE